MIRFLSIKGSIRTWMAVSSLVLFFWIFSFPVMGIPSRPPETVGSRPNFFAEKYFLKIDSGLITLIARGNPLGSVLEEISKRAGEKIVISPALRSMKITARWEGLTLEEGLRKIAENSGLLFEKDEEGIFFLSASGSARGDAPANMKNISQKKSAGISPEKSVLSGGGGTQNKDSENSILLKEMVIRFKQDLSEQDIIHFLSNVNIKVKKYIVPLKCHILSLPEGMTSYDAMVLFKKKKMLYQAESDYLIPVK